MRLYDAGQLMPLKRRRQTPLFRVGIIVSVAQDFGGFGFHSLGFWLDLV